jgi:hypothetical protein
MHMRPVWKPSNEDLEKIRELANEGYTEDGIAKAIGISSSTWFFRKKDYPEVQEILDESKRSKVQIARSKLWKMVTNEDHKSHFNAVKYFLDKYDTEGVIVQNNIMLPSGFKISIVGSDKDAD